jgi:hypothetical protein
MIGSQERTAMPYQSEHLSDRDREALRLAASLRARMTEWMSGRGIPGGVRITPYVDRTGQPSVLVRMNPHLVHAMLRSFDQRHELRERPYQQAQRSSDSPR